MERIKPEAYKLSRYISPEGKFNYQALQNDTPALALEASINKEIKKRIWRTVEAVWHGKVVQGSLDKGKDVLEFFADTSEDFRKEKEAGRQIREHLLNGEIGSIFIQIFPPNKELGHEEGRLRIGIKKKKLGIDVLLTYGIPLVSVTPKDCMYQFWRLSEFTNQEIGNVKSPEDLRDKVLTFIPPNNENWLEFLKSEVSGKLVPKDVWLEIKNGNVAREARSAKGKTNKIISSHRRAIAGAVSRRNYSELIYIGARIEQEIIASGRNIVNNSCGKLNLDILKDSELQRLVNSGSPVMIIDQQGNITKIESKYVKNCGKCGAKIEAFISKGYVCKFCGGTYEGC